MSVNDLKRRWRDPAFIEKVAPVLNSIFVEKTLVKNADLRGIPIGVDDSPEPLAHASFIRVALDGADASESSLSCSFHEGSLRNVRFSRARFDTCIFGKASFDKCIFDSSFIDSPFLADATFQHCSFIGAKITARGLQEYGGRRVVFEHCDFSQAVLQNLQLRACAFRECVFHAIQIRNCLLVGVKFEGEKPLPQSFENCIS